MELSHTLKKSIHLSGIGVHSGKNVNISLLPDEGGEIIFQRTDLKGMTFALDVESMITRNSTVLVQNDNKIQTIEHLMASLFALNINSLIIELDGEEVPILDGSAQVFTDALLEGGIRTLPIQKKALQISKSFRLHEHDAYITVAPHPKFLVSYSIEFDHPAIGIQELSLEVNRETFSQEIAPARTFAFLKDVPDLRARDLALGGSLENALVLDDTKVINGPLRFQDEFVRHKILDLIGDLSLMERPLCGHFIAHKAGHNLHLRTVRFLLENPDFWIEV